MEKLKVMPVFGTRPEAIKMAPLIKALERREAFSVTTCVTGQHREMLQDALRLFDITPAYNLNVMRPNQDLYDITATVITRMRAVLLEARPDIVLVHGDTTTCLAAALAAFYAHVPVAHVEAGLRTADTDNPWPEEMNRRLADRLSTLHFAPTPLNRDNLLAEGIDPRHVYVTGNTVIDALRGSLDRIHSNPDLARTLMDEITASGYPVGQSNHRRLVLITGHRRENFGDGFERICRAIHALALAYTDTDFVYPVHLNPNVRQAVSRVLGNNKPANLHLIGPLGYFSFACLMERATLVLTDSGGIQEEAPALGKPVLVMRSTTERPEAVSAGTVRLVGADKDNIIASVADLLDNPKAYHAMSSAVNPYGNGHAAELIADILSAWMRE